MKRSGIFLLAVLVISVFSVNSVFAINDPIPGVDIVVKKNPGGIAIATTKTDKAGKFSIKLGASLTKEGNRFDLQLSYDAIMKTLSRTDPAFAKNKENYKITLELTGSGPGITVNDKAGPVKIIIDNRTETLSLFDRLGNGFISGTLTYELRASRPK